MCWLCFDLTPSMHFCHTTTSQDSVRNKSWCRVSSLELLTEVRVLKGIQLSSFALNIGKGYNPLRLLSSDYSLLSCIVIFISSHFCKECLVLDLPHVQTVTSSLTYLLETRNFRPWRVINAFGLLETESFNRFYEATDCWLFCNWMVNNSPDYIYTNERKLIYLVFRR